VAKNKKHNEMYVFADPESHMAQAFANNNDYVEDNHAVGHTQEGRTFVGVDTNISVRSDYNRGDYEYYRPSGRIPTEHREIIQTCMASYDRVGIIRNVIDLMADFACQGIRLEHPNKSVENFYNRWFEKVKGKERSERFLNMLYRAGNVVVKRREGHITKNQASRMKRARAADDIKFEEVSVRKNYIPLKYSFISPTTVEIIGGELAMFAGKPQYALLISNALKMAFNNVNRLGNKGFGTKELLKSLPKDIREALSKGKRMIPLDNDQISVYHYKKDDWQSWAHPMTYSILSDLIMLDKMKLADLSALDGAISQVRLWSLGHLDGVNSILPTKANINKLRNILANSAGGGPIDLVWGPELKFTESSSEVHKFLGKQKYEPTLDAVYDGLGISPALRSGSNASVNTNNFISLKTLIERLEYGRIILNEFWQQEVVRVQKAMGFHHAPTIRYDRIILADEAAEKALLIQLLGMDVICEESVVARFNLNPEIENLRKQKEDTERVDGTRSLKAGPYHNPQNTEELKKILLNGGGVAPSELGIQLEEKKTGEQTRLEQQLDMQIKVNKGKPETKPKGDPNSGGRPKNKTETKKRKPKPTAKPRTKAFVDLFIWGNEAQKAVSELVTPALLNAYGKKNVRSLTKAEFAESEKIKFGILCYLQPYQEVSAELVYSLLSKECPVDNPIIASLQDVLMGQFISNQGRKPSVDESRQIQSSIFALINEGEEECK